ncbi:hypothetical protein L9F63_017968, partial [Diploptera punctata]
MTKMKDIGVTQIFLATHSGLTRWVALWDDFEA